MLTEKMMQIADNPSDPWLETYLKEHGHPSFKYGKFRGYVQARTNKEAPVFAETAPVKEQQFDAQDALIKHLATKVKAAS